MVISIVEIRDGVLLALASLRENKLRAGLTILGVLIGVASVIGMASIIAGLDKMVLQEIENLGSNVIYITKFPPNTEYDKLTEEERNRKDITFEEAEAIRQTCPSVSAISPQNHYRATGGNVVKYKGNQANRPDVLRRHAGLCQGQQSGPRQGAVLQRFRRPAASHDLRRRQRHRQGSVPG